MLGPKNYFVRNHFVSQDLPTMRSRPVNDGLGYIDNTLEDRSGRHGPLAFPGKNLLLLQALGAGGGRESSLLSRQPRPGVAARKQTQHQPIYRAAERARPTQGAFPGSQGTQRCRPKTIITKLPSCYNIFAALLYSPPFLGRSLDLCNAPTRNTCGDREIFLFSNFPFAGLLARFRIDLVFFYFSVLLFTLLDSPRPLPASCALRDI